MLKYGVPDEDLGEDTLRDLTLRVAGIMDDSIVDGPGVRLALFVQGCSAIIRRHGTRQAVRNALSRM